MNQMSLELKQRMLERMMPPKNERVSEIARENGISEATLYKWKKEAKAQGLVMPNGNQPTKQWSSRDKFSIVVETAALSEIEIAEYCRAKGLYVEQVEEWRDACMQANGGVAEQAAKRSPVKRTRSKGTQS